MTAQQWRLMLSRRPSNAKKAPDVSWLGEHAPSHHKLTVQFQRQAGRTDIVAVLQQAAARCSDFCKPKATVLLSKSKDLSHPCGKRDIHHHRQSCNMSETRLVIVSETCLLAATFRAKSLSFS